MKVFSRCRKKLNNKAGKGGILMKKNDLVNDHIFENSLTTYFFVNYLRKTLLLESLILSIREILCLCVQAKAYTTQLCEE